MRKLWHDEAWEEYLYWQSQDKKTLKKINRLLTDIDRNGYQCTGKPEPLGENLARCSNDISFAFLGLANTAGIFSPFSD